MLKCDESKKFEKWPKQISLFPSQNSLCFHYVKFLGFCFVFWRFSLTDKNRDHCNTRAPRLDEMHTMCIWHRKTHWKYDKKQFLEIRAPFLRVQTFSSKWYFPDRAYAPAKDDSYNTAFAKRRRSVGPAAAPTELFYQQLLTLMRLDPLHDWSRLPKCLTKTQGAS